MRVLISDLLRKVAYAIELDETPADQDLEDKKKPKPRSGDDTAEHDVVKPTAEPTQRPKRRERSYKTGPWDSKQHRKEYMQDWRADGKDIETGNKYVKKNKSK